MLIIGKISGIQDYLFDVAAEGGGQAKRLRAQSFFMQILTETLAIRTADAFKLSVKDALIFCNAGKFALEDRSVDENSATKIQQNLSSETNKELLLDTSARLSFSLIVSKTDAGSIEAVYSKAMRKLNFVKKQSWASAAVSGGIWDVGSLILPSLGEPCELCRREKAVVVEKGEDEAEIIRRICRTCQTMREIGKQLPQNRNKWVILSPNEVGEFKVGSWQFRFAESPSVKSDEFALSLEGAEKFGTENEDRILSRHLVRSIPNERGKPLEFLELAQKAEGDKLLGLLKMDADSLGAYINQLNEKSQTFTPLKEFSKKLDEFFAKTLSQNLKQSKWKNIYPVFAGGDDLMLVGAWNEVFDFAGEIQRAFAENFSAENLTISGGLAIFKPKMPIKNVAAEAEELLSNAKENFINGENRNQFAAFGQIWKWKDHQTITNQARQLVAWIDEGKFQRGWLHTLLRLAMWREIPKNSENYANRYTATSKLAYHVARNYPRVRDAHSTDTRIRLWANNLIVDFDAQENVETKYLAATVRYALTATRSKSREENQ